MIRPWERRCSIVLAITTLWGPAHRLQSQSLPDRETLQYTIEWRLITAGKARLEWSPAPASGGGGWRTGVHVESTGLISKFFKVDDDYSSLLDEKLCGESLHLSSHEGSRQRDTKVTFDRERRKASYLERDLVKNTTIEQEVDIPPCVHDIVGSLYRLRTMEVEVGQTVQIPVSDGKKSVQARVDCQRKESVKTPGGLFKTVRYEAFLFNNVIYRRPGHVYVWLTDDRRRLPVQIQVRLQLHIGTITVQLEKEGK